MIFTTFQIKKQALLYFFTFFSAADGAGHHENMRRYSAGPHGIVLRQNFQINAVNFKFRFYSFFRYKQGNVSGEAGKQIIPA